jgi:hypothetical protein
VEGRKGGREEEMKREEMKSGKEEKEEDTCRLSALSPHGIAQGPLGS